MVNEMVTHNGNSSSSVTIVGTGTIRGIGIVDSIDGLLPQSADDGYHGIPSASEKKISALISESECLIDNALPTRGRGSGGCSDTDDPTPNDRTSIVSFIISLCEVD